ncbi:cyclophilin-like fold protein [Pleomorphomonas sp. PLEO]|uniref:cyclophilin-like fold protein n=1 Tax=Pleomorphomonas sp. PLEO TaxID=3239306 RepID=UPI00351DC14A
MNGIQKTLGLPVALAVGLSGPAVAAERIRIASEWGSVTATLSDNAAAKALAAMLPLTIDMSDHMRQEKTGALPQPLPEVARQRDFRPGTLGLWSDGDFVIYYRSGRVPSPGIVWLGEVTGDVTMFDRPGEVTVRVEKVE